MCSPDSACRISIIIPVINEALVLPRLLAVLRPWRSECCEVIVVDGGSSDGTQEQARSGADRLITTASGRAIQMNAGAAEARGEVLWFLHADTLPPNDGVERICDSVAGGYGWGRFDVRLSGRAGILRVVERMMNWRSRLSGIATGDQAIFVRRDWFQGEGGYPCIALMEDVALCRTLKHRGPPACLHERVVTSSRRWEQGGIVKTILLMWRLRFAYWFGADPQRLAREYRRVNRP